MTTHPNQPTQAILCVLWGMAILAFIDNTVPLISDQISLWQFHFLRSLLAVPLLALVLMALGLRLQAKRWWAIAVRAGLLAASMVIYFGALGFLPISDVVAGLFASPLVVVVITALFLPERVGAVRWLAAAVGFAGTLMVLQPEVGGFTTLNAIPLAAAVFYALGSIATRTLCDGETTESMLFMYFVMMLVIGGLGVMWITFVMPGGQTYLTRAFAWPGAQVWAILLLQAAGSLVGIGLLLRAYIVGQASTVSIIEYSMLIFAPVVAWLYFGHTIGPLGAMGMILIITSGTVIAWRSRAQ
ncbi:MAG: DMT family transporter [Pseudomonadota bacterium]